MSQVNPIAAGFPVLLGLLFITLKLVGSIAWSWWWVLSPFWIGFAILLGLAVGALAIWGMAFIVGSACLRGPKKYLAWLKK